MRKAVGENPSRIKDDHFLIVWQPAVLMPRDLDWQQTIRKSRKVGHSFIHDSIIVLRAPWGPCRTLRMMTVYLLWLAVRVSVCGEVRGGIFLRAKYGMTRNAAIGRCKTDPSSSHKMYAPPRFLDTTMRGPKYRFRIRLLSVFSMAVLRIKTRSPRWKSKSRMVEHGLLEQQNEDATSAPGASEAPQRDVRSTRWWTGLARAVVRGKSLLKYQGEGGDAFPWQ
jgi:hypothetical protein